MPRTCVRMWDPEEEWGYVPEDEIPLGMIEDVPPTGDSIGHGAVLALGSAFGLTMLYAGRPRKKEN